MKTMTIAKNGREELRIELSDYKGRQLLNFRIWFKGDDGNMRPGRDGFALKVDALPEVAKALAELEATARADGLI